MRANLKMPALLRFDEVAYLVVTLPGALLFFGICDFADEVTEQARVTLLPKENAIRCLAIASGAAGLLVILLDRLWVREVNHSPHSCFVDAQAERNCADEHANFVGHPAFLVLLARGVAHFCVIGEGRDSPFRQKSHGLFHSLDRWRVNDHVAARVALERFHEQVRLRPRAAFPYDIA
jgi:hypothetical protein